MSDLSRFQGSGRGTWAVIRLLQCIRGPKLRRFIYLGNNEGVPYEPNKLERYADSVITAAGVLWAVILYTSPLYFVYYLVRYGVPPLSGFASLCRSLVFIPISFSLAYFVRGVGRYRNESYGEFLKALNSAKRINTRIGPREEKLTGISGYDFCTSALPVTFRFDQSSIKPRRVMSSRRKTLWERVKHFPLSTARFVAAHLVGRRLIYPGSVSLYNKLVESFLSTGRAKLRRDHDAHRAKLLAADGNTIDCMFVDHRGSPDIAAKGNKVVICCEGNAAFYELGMMEIPLSCGYSAIGWNHPGFGDSSGLPLPTQEFNAIDVVIRYAISGLGFALEDVILYAWSIGGYTASCAAMSYPDVGAVVIDASFDELYPLVTTRVSPYLHEFTRGMVEEYYNLNIAEQMSRYPGPVRIIRRVFDEMMSVQSDIGSNRGNYLLIKLLQERYPHIIVEQTLVSLWQWLRAETESDRSMLTRGVNRKMCSLQLKSYMAEFGPFYPWTIGNNMTLAEKQEMTLFLAEQYMSNYDATHCTPLDKDYFRVPSAGNFAL